MRTKLPNKRGSVNRKILYRPYGGGELKIIVTVGYDDDSRAREVFCADFKAGSDTQAIVMDACILVSRLLQHGDPLEDLADGMCSPPSLIGTIVRAILDEQGPTEPDALEARTDALQPEAT